MSQDTRVASILTRDLFDAPSLKLAIETDGRDSFLIRNRGNPWEVVAKGLTYVEAQKLCRRLMTSVK